MKTIFACVAFCLLASSGMSAPVTVRVMHYDGWNCAYRVSNGAVDLVVVPGIGRIVSFALTGHPETNPIYTNPGTASRFIEMEVLGPMTHLRAGQHMVYRYSWNLQRLPRRPTNHADAEHLVIALMKH